jgi:hypothetical protein
VKRLDRQRWRRFAVLYGKPRRPNLLALDAGEIAAWIVVNVSPQRADRIAKAIEPATVDLARRYARLMDALHRRGWRAAMTGARRIQRNHPAEGVNLQGEADLHGK